MKIALYCVGGTALVLLILMWMMTQIHYRIGSRQLKIMLFGIPLRRIPLANIVYASKREPRGFAERWHSTFKTSHRLVTLELNRGIRKYICITPRNRYSFIGDLKSAIRRVNPDNEWAQAKATEDSTSLIERPAITNRLNEK